MAAILLLVFAGIFYAVIMRLNSGHFAFTLDDAYIHLALAENIWQGHYGINLGEYSAPASSIVWPVLIAPVAGLPFAEHLVLLANIIFALLTLLLFYRILQPDEQAATPDEQKSNHTLLNVMLILLIPACNLLGLVFCGMEHSLQVMLSVAILYGLTKELRTSQAQWWLCVAIILAPLVRYECLAISLPATAYLFFRSHRKVAVVSIVVLLSILGGFSLYLVSIGQSPIPSSIAAKSEIMHSHSLASVFDNFIYGVQNPRGILLAVLMLLVAVRLLVGDSGLAFSAERALILSALAAMLLHLFFGKYGWYSRYEIYIWSFSLACLGYFMKPMIYRANLKNTAGIVLLMFVAVVLLCFPYLMVLPTIPLAANNIYEQHYQMHRFVADFYKRPVAANDIGYLAYRNAAHVLDLWGLASSDALKLRLDEKMRPDLLEEFVSSKKVDLVMVYEEWFDKLPDRWIRLGILKLGKPKITPDREAVSFYAANKDSAPELLELLGSFSVSLPEGAGFVFDEKSGFLDLNGAEE